MTPAPANRPIPAYGFAPHPFRLIPGLEQITPEWAFGGSTGACVKVAVIDSGIDADHPAIGPRGVQGYVEVRSQAGSDDPDAVEYHTEPHVDAFGHGTACAGIIRAAAPDCDLYSVKVLGPVLNGRGVIFAAGLRWAIENRMDVCNLSLGTTKRDFYGVLHEIADEAYFRNVLLVAAANNMAIPSFPSLYASVISVACHEDVHDDTLYYNSAQPPVEFAAAGIDVRVPWLHGGFVTATGNSFAAPHITGLVAKIRGKHPDLSPMHVKIVLRALSANAIRPDE